MAALGRVHLVCRGPKPVAALKEIGLAATLTVPEPNTWRDVLTELDLKLSIADKRVAVQEYGARNAELLTGLEQRGARVTAVRVYGWTLPETRDSARGDRQVVAGEVEAALFTSSNQVDNLFLVAREMGQAAAVRDALGDRTVVASIGPITTEALRRTASNPTCTLNTQRWGTCWRRWPATRPICSAETRRPRGWSG